MIEIKNGMFLLDKKPFFIYSGEVQYFRIKKDKWSSVLCEAKKANLNTISSYIPWCWHERSEGVFDFEGKSCPETNLIGFLEAVKKSGLYFFARLGPISNAELINEGLPKWFPGKYPNALLRKQDNAISFKPAIISYLHPDFQRSVTLWYQKLLPIIEKYQLKNGGPVILLQLCNEIGMLNWIMKQPDYNEYTTGFYRQYLTLHYKLIRNVNRAYKTKFRNFTEINQPFPETEEKDFLLHLDWAYFYRDYFSRYYHALTVNLKNYDLNLPLVANIPQFLDYDLCGRAYQGITTTSLFRDFSARLQDIILGGAYQVRRCDIENFHDIVVMNEMIKTISHAQAPKMCVEMQFGGWQDRPRIYPKDVELPIKLSVSHGLNGINGYVFCGGKNSKGLAFRGTYNEWQAPLDSKGKPKPHLQTISNLGLFFKTFGPLIEKTTNVYDDISIGFYQPYFATEFLSGDLICNVTTKRDKLFFDGILRLVTLAGFKFSLFDLEREPLEELKKRRCVWVFSLSFMDTGTQDKLVQYVQSGGRLILSPKIPTVDLSFKKQDVLINAFGIKDLQTSGDTIVYLKEKNLDVYTDSEIEVFNIRNAKLIATTERGIPCAALKKIGKGSALILGFGLPHIFDYHIEVVKYIINLFNINPCVLSTDAVVHTVLRRNDEFGFLGVFNLDDIEKKARITLNVTFKGKRAVFSKKNITFARRAALILPLNVPLDNHLKVLYSTVELAGFAINRRALTLRFFSEIESYFEIALCGLKQPKYIYLGKDKLYCKSTGSTVIIQGRAKQGLQALKIGY
ncbi:MAG: beta-galactosidase [Candidatus Omnitrophota bacterium]